MNKRTSLLLAMHKRNSISVQRRQSGAALEQPAPHMTAHSDGHRQETQTAPDVPTGDDDGGLRTATAKATRDSITEKKDNTQYGPARSLPAQGAKRGSVSLGTMVQGQQGAEVKMTESLRKLGAKVAADSVKARMERMQKRAKKQALAVPNLAVVTGTKRYECPVYRTSARGRASDGSSHEGLSQSAAERGLGQNGLVCKVLLPTAAYPDQWVLRGLALICEPPQE